MQYIFIVQIFSSLLCSRELKIESTEPDKIQRYSFKDNYPIYHTNVYRFFKNVFFMIVKKSTLSRVTRTKEKYEPR